MVGADADRITTSWPTKLSLCGFDKSDRRQLSDDFVEVFKFVPKGGSGRGGRFKTAANTMSQTTVHPEKELSTKNGERNILAKRAKIGSFPFGTYKGFLIDAGHIVRSIAAATLRQRAMRSSNCLKVNDW